MTIEIENEIESETESETERKIVMTGIGVVNKKPIEIVVLFLVKIDRVREVRTSPTTGMTWRSSRGRPERGR